jgi:YD repeat-containing protein
MKEITEHDERGNPIHYRNSDGYEVWNEYDENNNMIHFRNSDGVVVKY